MLITHTCKSPFPLVAAGEVESVSLFTDGRVVGSGRGCIPPLGL